MDSATATGDPLLFAPEVLAALEEALSAAVASVMHPPAAGEEEAGLLASVPDPVCAAVKV